MIHEIIIHRTTANILKPPSAAQQKTIEKLYEIRKQRIKEAHQAYETILNLEEAYKQLCRDRGLKYIPPHIVHHAAAAKQQAPPRMTLPCPVCETMTVTVDRICHECPQYAQGFRYSSTCSQCLRTTFSTKDPVVKYKQRLARRLALRKSRKSQKDFTILFVPCPRCGQQTLYEIASCCGNPNGLIECSECEFTEDPKVFQERRL
jgi:hypothetical protein